MDSNQSSQTYDSQFYDDDIPLSQSVLSQTSHFPYSTPPFPMPPHGFTAMMTSPSSTSPFFFGPPPPNLSQRPPFPSMGTKPRRSLSPKPPSPTMATRPPSLSPTVPSPAMATMPQSSSPHSIENATNVNPPPSQATKSRAKNPKKNLVETDVEVQECTSSKKPRVMKKKGMVDVVDDDNNDTKGKGKWKPFWVDQLIHVRGSMDTEFRVPQKQGVNLWAKVADKLAATYHDFDKDSEGCRKKWRSVIGEYKLDRAHNSVSGNDRRRTCKWYDVVDEYYHDRAAVTCVSHASSTTSTHDVGVTEGDLPIEGDSQANECKPQQSSSSAKRTIPKSDESLAEMADTGRALLDHLKEASATHVTLERERLQLLAQFHTTMAGFLDQNKNT